MKNLSTPVLLLLILCLLAQSAAAAGPKEAQPVPIAPAAGPEGLAEPVVLGSVAPGPVAVDTLREMPPGDLAAYQAALPGIIAQDAAERAAASGPMDEATAARFRAEILERGSSQDPAAAFARFGAKDGGASIEEQGSSLFDGIALSVKRALYLDGRTLKNGDLAGLKELLGRAGWDRRIKVVEQMKTRFPKESVADLVELARTDKDLRVRQAAMQALGELKDAEAVEPLIQIAQHGGDEDSSAASQALGSIGDLRAQPVLLAAFNGSLSETPRFTGAAEGLLRLGHEHGLAAIGGRMEAELSASIQAGGWKRQPTTGFMLDRYHEAGDKDPLVPAMTRAFTFVKQDQAALVLRKAVKLIDQGGHKTVDWADVGITVFIGLLFGWVALVVMLLWSLGVGSFFTYAKGAENLQPAADEVLG